MWSDDKGINYVCITQLKIVDDVATSKSKKKETICYSQCQSFKKWPKEGVRNEKRNNYQFISAKLHCSTTIYEVKKTLQRNISQVSQGQKQMHLNNNGIAISTWSLSDWRKRRLRQLPFGILMRRVTAFLSSKVGSQGREDLFAACFDLSLSCQQDR